MNIMTYFSGLVRVLTVPQMLDAKTPIFIFKVEISQMKTAQPVLLLSFDDFFLNNIMINDYLFIEGSFYDQKLDSIDFYYTECNILTMNLLRYEVYTEL